MPPKHDRSESDSSDEMLRQAKRIARANHNARTTATKFTTKVRNAKTADTAEHRAEMTQLVHTEEAKLWKADQDKKKRAKERKEKKRVEAAFAMPRSESENSGTGSISSLDSQVLLFISIFISHRDLIFKLIFYVCGHSMRWFLNFETLRWSKRTHPPLASHPIALPPPQQAPQVFFFPKLLKPLLLQILGFLLVVVQEKKAKEIPWIPLHNNSNESMPPTPV